jgi:hypothetical protein
MFLATAHTAQPPVWLSRELSDLSGLDSDSPCWLSSKFSLEFPWDSFVGRSLLLYIWHCSHSAPLMVKYSAPSLHQFCWVLHYSFSLFLILLLFDYCLISVQVLFIILNLKTYSRYFNLIMKSQENFTHRQIFSSQHHTSQNSPTFIWP